MIKKLTLATGLYSRLEAVLFLRPKCNYRPKNIAINIKNPAPLLYDIPIFQSTNLLCCCSQ